MTITTDNNNDYKQFKYNLTHFETWQSEYDDNNDYKQFKSPEAEQQNLHYIHWHAYTYTHIRQLKSFKNKLGSWGWGIENLLFVVGFKQIIIIIINNSYKALFFNQS